MSGMVQEIVWVWAALSGAKYSPFCHFDTSHPCKLAHDDSDVNYFHFLVNHNHSAPVPNPHLAQEWSGVFPNLDYIMYIF
jgi:hypothetical protein